MQSATMQKISDCIFELQIFSQWKIVTVQNEQLTPVVPRWEEIQNQCLTWSHGVLTKVQEEQLRGSVCRSKVKNDFHVLMVFLWLAVFVLFSWIHARKRGIYLKDKGSVC